MWFLTSLSKLNKNTRACAQSRKSYLKKKKKKLSVTKKTGTNMTLDGHFQSFKMFFIKEKKRSYPFIPDLNLLKNFF